MLKSRVCVTTVEVCGFINKNEIKKENIVSLITTSSGSFVIFYWE